jgi:hypothetical protein
VGVNAAAVSVNCEMTVLAAEVRMTATSGVGSPSGGGFTDPHAAITTVATTMTLTVNLSLIEPLYVLKDISSYFFT